MNLGGKAPEKSGKAPTSPEVQEEEVPEIVQTGLFLLSDLKPRLTTLTEEDSSKLLDYLDDLDKYLQDTAPELVDTRFQNMLIQFVFDCFIEAPPGDLKAALLSVLASAVDAISNKNLFVSSAFLDQLHMCCTAGVPTVSELAQWILMRMVNCESFYQLRKVDYWMDAVSNVDQHLFQAVILAKIADHDPTDIGESLAPELGRRLLVCLLNDSEKIDTVRYACLGLTRVVYYFSESFQFDQVTSEIRRQMGTICDIMLRMRTRKIYTMMECFVVKGIAREFFNDRDNVAFWEDHFGKALENGDEKSVTRLIQLMAVLVRERVWVPFSVFNTAMEVCRDKSFKVKYWAVKVICQYIAQYDCPPSMDSGFVPVLLDLIMIPAMELMKEMLECLYTLMDRYPGFMDMLMNRWDEFDQFPDKLNEIESNLDGKEEDVGEAIENIRHKIRTELPRSPHEIYPS